MKLKELRNSCRTRTFQSFQEVPNAWMFHTMSAKLSTFPPYWLTVHFVVGLTVGAIYLCNCVFWQLEIVWVIVTQGAGRSCGFSLSAASTEIKGRNWENKCNPLLRKVICQVLQRTFVGSEGIVQHTNRSPFLATRWWDDTQPRHIGRWYWKYGN